MRAAVLVLLLGIAPSVSAENAVLGDATRELFVGGSGRYIHDGRRGTQGYWYHEGVSGAGGALEGGLVIRPWVSVSLIGRLGYVSETIETDPGTADYTERQITVGPRVDVWPVAGRLRIGAAIAGTLRRSETHFWPSRILGPSPERTVTDETTGSTLELQIGVVPLRWRGYELEVNGSVARESDAPHWGDEAVYTYALGLGLRWRFAR